MGWVLPCRRVLPKLGGFRLLGGSHLRRLLHEVRELPRKGLRVPESGRFSWRLPQQVRRWLGRHPPAPVVQSSQSAVPCPLLVSLPTCGSLCPSGKCPPGTRFPSVPSEEGAWGWVLQRLARLTRVGRFPYAGKQPIWKAPSEGGSSRVAGEAAGKGQATPAASHGRPSAACVKKITIL